MIQRQRNWLTQMPPHVDEGGALLLAFHNVAKGLEPPGFKKVGLPTCACGKPLSVTHMAVCTQGELPHKGQVGRRVAHVVHGGGAKDERHDAVAWELAN